MLNKTYFTSFVTARNKASEAHVDNAQETYSLLLFYTSVSVSRKTYGRFRVRNSVQNYARGKRSEIHNFGMPLIQNGCRCINYFHEKCLNEIKNEVGRLSIWHNDQLA